MTKAINPKSKILNPKQIQTLKFKTTRESFVLRILGLFSVLCLGFWALASVSQADPFIDSVLKDGIGVRALGMGGAFVSVADDSDAVYYNPAGLSTAATQFIKNYMDVNTDQNSLNDSYSFATKQVGFAYWRKEDKTGQRGGVTAVSFGTMGDNGISWGITQKNVAYDLASSSQRGWTADAGLKAGLSSELTAGILLQDLVKNNVPVSTSIRLGLCLSPESMKNARIVAEGEFRDLKSPNGATTFMHYGVESKITNGLILRGGWAKDRFTAGATATFPYLIFDYGLIINPDSKNTQLFGFRLSDER